MATGAEVAAMLADITRRGVTAGDVRAVVDRGWQVLDAIMAGDAAVDVQLLTDVQRAREVLAHGRSAVEGMADDALIEPGTIAWTQAAAPIIAGECYGPPACHEQAIEAWGSVPFPIAPWGARPWTLQVASEELAQARRDALDALRKDLVREAGEVAAAAGRGISTGIGIVVGLWMLFQLGSGDED